MELAYKSDPCQRRLEQTQKHPSLTHMQFRIARGLKSIFHRFCNRPHVGIWTASHAFMHLVLVGNSFIPKGPWKLLWLVQAHRPVFGLVKLAPIKYEKTSHDGAHQDELQHGVYIQSSINLGKTFPRISRIRNIPSTQILARFFVYLLPFTSQILDFICRMVLIFILIYFEWRDTENQQL